MNKNSRTKNTLISVATGVGGYIITYIVSFIYRTFFIYSLGKVYLGVQGLFSNILSMLALAELGISTAITFSLYKPIAQNDKEKIKSLMLYYKRAYRIIAVVVGVIGFSLTPFLSFFLKEMPNIREPIHLIYLLYVSDIVLSYFCVYKQSLMRADQKVYLISIVTNVASLIRSFLQIIWLAIFRTFIPVLLIQIFCTIAANIILAKIANKQYPYLLEKDVKLLDLETRKDITNKVRSLFLYKIGAFVVNGTDNLLISKFIGILSVGIYSNYNMIISMVNTVTGYLIKAITPSVGNYVAIKSEDEAHDMFEELNFFLFWIYSLCSVFFIALFDVFIELWLGKDYLIGQAITWVLVLNFYLYGLHQIQLIYRNVLGLYIYCKWKPVAEAIINIMASLILIKFFGFIGVFLGTTMSFVCTASWIEPYVLYKYYFHRSPLRYLRNYIIYFCYTICVCICILFIKNLYNDSGIIYFFLDAFLAVAIHTILFIVFFYQVKEFKKCWQRAKNIGSRIIRVKRNED